MATRLKWIVRFTTPIAAGASSSLPHGLNIDPPGGAGGPEPQIPDLVIPAKVTGWTVTADATNVTVTNNTSQEATIDVYVETWHTLERAFGDVALLELVPRPFVVSGDAEGNAASGVIGFGAGSIGTEIGFDWLWPWFDQDAQDLGSEGGFLVEMPAPRAGTLRNLYVRHNTAAGDGDAVVYALYVNGVVTTLTTSLVTGALGQASDTTHSVVIAQGDRLSLRATRAAVIGQGSTVALEIAATMRFDQ